MTPHVTLRAYAAEVLQVLTERNMTLAVAESDTGGLLLELLTAVPGSSAVVLGGVVAYGDGLKRTLLGVSAEVIHQYGAVSAEVAEAMASGVRRVAQAELAVATTGIAGPGGATKTKPVGLAYVAATCELRSLVREFHWRGDRAHNRTSSAEAALGLLIELAAK